MTKQELFDWLTITENRSIIQKRREIQKHAHLKALNEEQGELDFPMRGIGDCPYIENPDYFVTWDIVKKKDDAEEGQQEWWEWHPRVSSPSVN